MTEETFLYEIQVILIIIESSVTTTVYDDRVDAYNTFVQSYLRNHDFVETPKPKKFNPVIQVTEYNYQDMTEETVYQEVDTLIQEMTTTSDPIAYVQYENVVFDLEDGYIQTHPNFNGNFPAIPRCYLKNEKIGGSGPVGQTTDAPIKTEVINYNFNQMTEPEFMSDVDTLIVEMKQTPNKEQYNDLKAQLLKLENGYIQTHPQFAYELPATPAFTTVTTTEDMGAHPAVHTQVIEQPTPTLNAADAAVVAGHFNTETMTAPTFEHDAGVLVNEMNHAHSQGEYNKLKGELTDLEQGYEHAHPKVHVEIPETPIFHEPTAVTEVMTHKPVAQPLSTLHTGDAEGFIQVLPAEPVFESENQISDLNEDQFKEACGNFRTLLANTNNQEQYQKLAGDFNNFKDTFTQTHPHCSCCNSAEVINAPEFQITEPTFGSIQEVQNLTPQAYDTACNNFATAIQNSGSHEAAEKLNNDFQNFASAYQQTHPGCGIPEMPGF